MPGRPYRTHILDVFDEALGALRNDVTMMASLAERSIHNAFRGLVERNEDLCNVAIADDEEIDRLEVEVDRAGIAILTRFQPVASDLRQVISTMRVSNNLERVGDQGVNIARRARKLARKPALPEVALLETMYPLAVAMLRDATAAFVQLDSELARSLATRDDELDQLNKEIAVKLTELMAAQPGKVEDYLALLFIARHLERIGDYAQNVGEDAVYAIAAEDIRHRPPNATG